MECGGKGAHGKGCEKDSFMCSGRGRHGDKFAYLRAYGLIASRRLCGRGAFATGDQ